MSSAGSYFGEKDEDVVKESPSPLITYRNSVLV
jgi:hypothetical protein